MALSLLVLGFMAFRLLIKDKVKPSAAPVRQPTGPPGAKPLCPAEKAPSRTLPPALAAQSPPAAGYRRRGRNRTTGAGLRQQQWLEGNRTVLIYGGNLITEPDQEKYAALRKRRGRPLDGIVR